MDSQVGPPPFAISLPGLNFEAEKTNEAAFPTGTNKLVGTTYGVGWDPALEDAGRQQTVRFLVMTTDILAWVNAMDWRFDPLDFAATALNRGTRPETMRDLTA